MNDTARLFVLDVAEFSGIVECARRNAEYRVHANALGYLIIESATEIALTRRECGVPPAVWFGAATGGLDGHIVQFDRDTLRIRPGQP